MPIDERLRSGLAHNTELLVPDVEQALVTTYGRARSRQRVRRGALALTAAAAVAVTAWAVDLSGLDGDVVPVVPIPTPSDLVGPRTPLDPGTYSMAVWGDVEADDLPRAILDVPDGYFSNGGFAVDAGNQYQEPDQRGEVAVWRVDQVLSDPCHLRTAAEVGPTVADLARALARQTGPSTRPSPVVLDGHRGLYLEVSHPSEADLSRCSYGSNSLWRTKLGLVYRQGLPGVVNHLWILDVDGIRLVIAVSNYSDQTDQQHQELLAIAESIHFVAPDS